jgi:hypothetical protein
MWSQLTKSQSVSTIKSWGRELPSLARYGALLMMLAVG